MYTMKIVLFNILLICVISEINATWSTISLAQRIGLMKEKLSEEEAKQDILSLLNIDSEDGSKSVRLQNFPLKKLFKADFSQAPMFEKVKKIKSKPQETLEVVSLDKPQTLYSDFNSKYPKQYLTPSQLDDDSQSNKMILNNKIVNSDSSETDEMLFVIRLPPNYSYIKGQPLQNKPYKDNIPPKADGLSVEDMTVLEIPPDIKESKKYYFKPNNKPQMKFYQNQNAGRHYYKPKHSKLNKKLMQLIKRLMFQSKMKREMHTLKNSYRVGDNVMGRLTKVIKHNSMTYYDKLKEYLQELVAKLLNKAMKQREDQEKFRRRNYRHRMKRETQAGYTQDPDTCKKYNENLEKMWDTLSKYLNSTDSVDQQALHNIAVMVEAYMEHQSERPHLEEVDQYQEKKKDKISEVLKRIRKLLGDENATEKVKEMVLQNFKPEYKDNTECKQTNEDNLLSSIDLSYKNYLDNAKCHGDYDTGLLRGKALLRNGTPMKPKDMSDRQFYDTYVVHKNILDEVETSKEFYRGRIPANKRNKKHGRFNRRNDRRSFGRSAKLSRYALQSKKRHTGHRRRPKKSLKKRSRPKKSHIRSDEACVKYANRKFLITLRTSIERFMDLRDCHQDDTLRTSNKNRKATNRRRKQALRTPNKRKFKDMTLYSDTELGKKERSRINNYLGNIKDFNDPEINRNKSIVIVHTTSYKSPLLLKLNNKREGMHGYTSNMMQPLGPGYYNKPSKYGFDTIYKSFLESSDKDSFDTFKSKKTLVGGLQLSHRDGIRNINLYDIIKQKVDQEKYKRPFSIVGRQNGGENESLDVETIHYNNTSENVPPTNSNYTNMAQNRTSINFEEIGSMLDDVRNSTLQKPQIDASNFVSNNEKGFVELSYLVKYPKSIVFRPQYLVKNILQYEEFVNLASQLYVTDEDKQLMKIVKYLPDNKTQILFETQDFKSPIEVFDVKEDIKKIKPIFSANLSDTNEALRQRTTNQTANYNYETENETPINVLPENRISPFRENDHANTSSKDKVSAGLILADDFTEDTINTDISNIEPLREDSIGTDITRAKTLSKDEIRTDLTNEDSLRESSSSADFSPVFQDNILTDENDIEETEDLIKSEINYLNLLRDSKISLDIDKVNHIQEENIAANADRGETLLEDKNDTQMFSTDSIQESSINAHISKSDILRNDNNSIDDDQTDHLSDDKINRELNGTDFLRDIEISTDTNKVDSLKEDEDRTSTEQNIGDFLQVVKINYDVDHPDHLRENNVSAIANHADLVQEDTITIDDSKEYIHLEDKFSSVLSEIDLLRQKKINPDAYHVVLLQENSKLNKKDSTDTNEQHLQGDDFNIDLSRIDALQEDKIIAGDNPSDSLLENSTKELNVDLLRESNIDIDVDRVYSLQESAISTESFLRHGDFTPENNINVNRVDLQNENMSSTDGNLAESLLKNTPDTHSLRDSKISIDSNKADSTQDDISIHSVEFLPGDKTSTEQNMADSLHTDSLISTKNNNAGQYEILTQTDNADSIQENKIGSEINLDNSLHKDNISTDHNNRNTLADDKSRSKLDNGDTLREIKINHEVEQKHNIHEENFSFEVKRDYLLAEDKITDVVNVNSLLESAIVTDARFEITTDSNRDNSLHKNGHSNEFTYSNENLPLGGADQLRNSKTNAEDFLQKENINSGVIRIDSNYRISSEVNGVDFDDQVEELRERISSTEANPLDSLLEDMINQKIVDALRGRDINTKIHHDDLLLEDKYSTQVNSNDYKQPDSKVDYLQNSKIDTDVKDALQVDDMKPDVSSVDLPKSKISIEVSLENINNDGNSIDPLSEGQTSNEFNRTDLFPTHEINAEVSRVDPLQYQISSEIDHEDTLREGNSSTFVSRAEVLPEETIKIDESHNINSHAAEIASKVTRSDSLKEDDISTDGNRSNTLPQDIRTTKYNNQNILRVTDVNHKDSLTEAKIETDVNNENLLQKDKVSSVIDNSNPLPEDILKKYPRDYKIKFNVNNEYSLSQDKIDKDDKTDIDVSNLQSDGIDKTNTELNYENQPTIDNISAEISSVTALRYNGFINSDRSEGEEVSTDNYSVNPLSKDIISNVINNSYSSHIDVLPDDNIKTDITRGDTLPGEEKNLGTDRVDPTQKDITIFEVNTQGPLRENNIDTNIKPTEDRLKDITYTGLNKDSKEEQIRTNVTRSGLLTKHKIEKDDFNLDARKEPRNYTDKLDYLTYQDGSIAEGLNTSSNEFERGGNLVELPNPVLNESSYKDNASSALREQIIDAFNDTLNSSEFINRKDDIPLNELSKNISLPDIDIESIADYLRFTLNNAEASLSTASQAYLKELESQGLTNAATTKVLLKNWWDAWKNKLTAKVQSIAGRVTNLFKKLDNTSISNEEPEIKQKFSNM